MFNLLISAIGWSSSPYKLHKSRAVVEYTANEISERYKFFNEKAIQELKNLPTLFVIENEMVESRIGSIINIHLYQDIIVIDFEFDPILPPLRTGAIEELRIDIDLGCWELTRTHWAIKDKPIYEILINKGFITQQQLDASLARKTPPPSPVVAPVNNGSSFLDTSQVFIVHGHDEIAKLEMSDFISNLGLNPIIIHMQASFGLTIIEKIERYSNVGFGIVLYTPCDVGSKVGDLSGKYRARQNVVFEHGFLIGKLTRQRVIAVVKGDIETPNDISGVVYVKLDANNNWQEEIKREMRQAGYRV